MEEDILEELARERDPSEELVYSMIGSRKLQILKVPTGGEGLAWELAHGPEGWVLSQSQAVDGELRPKLIGYTPLRCPSDAIGGIYTKITSVVVPFFLPQTNQGGQGGTFYEAAIWGGLYQSIRLRWWNDEPMGGWQVFVDYVNECIDFFEGLKVDERRAKWWETGA